ncbi:oxoisovalerate dehydrogenase subunit beta [Seminavis robusta]|uniref:Oxoisovalerate dehydrogenase subunit beta n=1 Tax=Seminavis robusta TaxID=568900 RepID=A0A9N8DET3_9STRA|nr:oxoisovalerate dehydrogenase subunit beta [Seminavis robusta]|eukprot:Sro37_g023110.1 oxoisovalerate dehydrogenase subunit beta (803) ;mRNA; f:30004-32660
MLRAQRISEKLARFGGGSSQWRHFTSSTQFCKPSLDDLRDDYHKEIAALPEQLGMQSLEAFLADKSSGNGELWKMSPPVPPKDGYRYTMNQDEIQITLDAALATFCLHVESRIAALVGAGFYTIGPCGEEMLSAIGLSLRDHDDAALHYRHSGVSLARQLRRRGRSDIDQILLDRARGYTVSKHDPVTGGVHCSIGSHTEGLGRDYVVTSTLASQCPSAVGRALGYSLAAKQKVLQQATNRNKPVSFVSVGDGSVHNHHFWSSFHLARHARHRNIQCPTVFGISNNGISISYETKNYVNTLFGNDPLVPLFEADAADMMQVYSETKRATEHARQRSAPAVILYQNITRRFGHAASDRQQAYLDPERIQAMAESDLLERAIMQAVEVFNALTYQEVKDRFQEIRASTRDAFSKASQEEKVTRSEMMERVATPTVTCPPLPSELTERTIEKPKSESTSKRPKKLDVMRKHMTRVLEESLANDDSVVYLGEDVEHGGYYLVTDQLSKKFPGRVVDFPPDETSLLGAAMGFSQVGLTPIVEIPYAKYLDCGADMFFEIAITDWLSAGKQPNGMLIRLQGFDRGLFGGNFHTHNMLSNIPPGVDVVCYSNGEDYVRGFRYALEKARAGRVVVSVDSTHLLNLRHVHEKDRGWERAYPVLEGAASADKMSFDEIIRYGTAGRCAVVTYGNGVVTALQARKSLVMKGLLQSDEELDILDCPLLSTVPAGLKKALPQYEGVLFADVCKEGPSNVLSSMIVSLHDDGVLQCPWVSAFAPRTYNPLGSVETFLNVDDIESAWKKLSEKVSRS